MTYEPKNWVDYPDTSTPITADELNRIEQQLAVVSTAPTGGVPPKVTNMYDYRETVLGWLSVSGNFNSHASNRVTEYLEVTPNTTYSFYNPNVSSSRIIWYGIDRNFVQYDSGARQEHLTIVSPENAFFLRVAASSPTGSPDDYTEGMIINRGPKLWAPGENVQSGWWDDRELPPSPTGVDEEGIRQIVQTLVPKWTPSFPTLNFDQLETGWQQPYWLSSDGLYVYGRQGGILLVSDDDWETKTDVHRFEDSIQGIRETGDGELIVSTNSRPNTVYKSSGFDPEDPTSATWNLVLDEGEEGARINNEWGMDFYQNIGVLSQYGNRGDEGARFVWFSEDYGDTWVKVFDLMTTVAPGRPEPAQDAHIHTSTWDPYWSRLWVVTGDSTSTGTYYSDDKGQTWNFVEGSNVMQYTGIIVFPDVVWFGSDRSPNGVHAYFRDSKDKSPKIEPLLLVDDDDVITRVFALPFRRGSDPSMPVYFTASPANDRRPSVIVATIDGKTAQVIWEGDQPGSGTERAGAIRWALGPTAQGRIIISMATTGTEDSGSRILRAPAPTWNLV